MGYQSMILKVTSSYQSKGVEFFLSSQSCNEPEPSSSKEEVNNKPLLRRLDTDIKFNSFCI